MSEPVHPVSPLTSGLPGLPEDAQERHELANQVSQRGIALLSSNNRSLLQEALFCFETAIVLRRDLDLTANPWFRWGLCAGWMNRGDVLTRLAHEGRLQQAVESYDEALAHLMHIPAGIPGMDVRGRHSLAWMNRAITLRNLHTDASLAEALRSLDQAEAILDSRSPALEAADPIACAAVSMNRGAVLMECRPPRSLDALRAADAALALTYSAEETQLLAAEVGLKARHVYLHGVAVLLETPPVNTAQADDWILHAEERVEEALRLAALWEARGQSFRDITSEIFEYGCRIYLAFQPQFLAEFLLDVLDPERGSPLYTGGEDFRIVGLAALEMAAEVMKRRGPLDLGLKGMNRVVKILEDLHAAGERIKKMPVAT